MTTERWALVPVEPTDAMDSAAEMALCGSIGGYEHGCWRSAWRAAMIETSPGAALLAEVLAARDALNLIVDDENAGPFEMLEPTYALLAALDKLGPAAEGAT
jgi:hypothetical protein